MSKVYQCHRCGGTFVPNDSLKVACAVLHGVDDCCHYGEQQISKLPNPSVSIDKDELYAILKNAKAVSSGSGEGWSGFKWITDLDQDYKLVNEYISAQQNTLLDRLKLPKEIKYIAEINRIRIAVNEALRGSEWHLRSKEEIEAYNQALKDCQQVIDQLRQELNGEKV